MLNIRGLHIDLTGLLVIHSKVNPLDLIKNLEVNTVSILRSEYEVDKQNVSQLEIWRGTSADKMSPLATTTANSSEINTDPKLKGTPNNDLWQDNWATCPDGYLMSGVSLGGVQCSKLTIPELINYE